MKINHLVKMMSQHLSNQVFKKKMNKFRKDKDSILKVKLSLDHTSRAEETKIMLILRIRQIVVK